jgi:hypothetical protein
MNGDKVYPGLLHDLDQFDRFAVRQLSDQIRHTKDAIPYLRSL